jgi:2-keto-3-deoxy-L-rhamnonate aldolase RhmA
VWCTAFLLLVPVACAGSLGADGVMVPLINTKEEAEQAVSYCLFPPEGQRSVAYPVRCEVPLW